MLPQQKGPEAFVLVKREPGAQVLLFDSETRFPGGVCAGPDGVPGASAPAGGDAAATGLKTREGAEVRIQGPFLHLSAFRHNSSLGLGSVPRKWYC